MSVSALLKSASATKKKIAQQEDAIQSYNWNSSAQTYDDFVNYSSYLKTRASAATDVSEQLSYQTALRGAQRSYTSNEIQRVQQQIDSGNGTTQDKMDAVRNLFDSAVNNGDANLAQNLLSQWQSLSIKQQNEQQASLKAYAAAGKAASDSLVKQLQDGSHDITLPTGHTVTPLKALGTIFQQNGDTVRTLNAAQETMDALRSAIIDKYQNATTQEEVDQLENTYGTGLANINSVLKVSVGGKTLNAQDVTNALANDKFNNPTYGLKAAYNETTGRSEYKLTTNNVDQINYARQIDAQGNEVYTPLQERTQSDNLFFGTSDQGRGIKTQINDTGFVIGGDTGLKDKKGNKLGNVAAAEGLTNRDESKTIENRLKAEGIQITQSSGDGTTVQIVLPGENVQRTATIQPDGTLRFMTDNGQIGEISPFKRNIGTEDNPIDVGPGTKLGAIRLVDPTELSDFGSQSKFGGTLSQASAQGNRYANEIFGAAPNTGSVLDGSNPIRVPTSLLMMKNPGNDFSGFGQAVTSNLLQGAQNTQRQIQLQQQEAAMVQAQQQAAAQLQAAQTFNLNQTPVQQLAANGVLKRQLTVAPPAPLPHITVGNAQSGTISGVSVAQPSRITSVGNNAFTGTVTVR